MDIDIKGTMIYHFSLCPGERHIYQSISSSAWLHHAHEVGTPEFAVEPQANLRLAFEIARHNLGACSDG